MAKPSDYQRLPTVPGAEELMRVALSRASRAREQLPKDATKRRARTTLREVDRYVTTLLLSIRRAFPDLASLSEPLPALIETELSLDDAKRALGSLQWAASRIGHLAKRFSAFIGMDPEEKAREHERSFLGRVRSVLGRIDAQLETVRALRRVLIALPVLREDALLVAIAGFPNVGKSTLLARLTSAKPEVAPYAFTTKGLNLGTLEASGVRFQFVDTPGTLDRETANAIERRAEIIIAHADVVVFVFDPTEQYPLDDQLALYERISAPIRYVSKTDLADPPARLRDLGPFVTDPEALVAALVARSRNRA